MAALREPLRLARLSSQQLAVLHWLLHHPRRPAATMRPVSLLENLGRQLPAAEAWLADMARNPSLRPQLVLELSPVAAAAAPTPASGAPQSVAALHGTSFENLHSILHLGLLNLSGTRLERTGAAFGSGIYLSTELTVAFEFSKAAPAWGQSAIGARLRCVLVVAVDAEAARAAAAGSETPQKYLIVDRCDALTISHVLVYVDDPAPAGAAHADHAAPAAFVQWLPLLALLAYLLWMLSIGFDGSWPLVRRALRRRGLAV